MTMRRVNGIALDGTSITLMFGRNQIACTKATYGDKIETAVLSHMGNQTIDERTMGSYATEDAKVSMSAVVFRAEMVPLLQTNGFGNEPIPIIFAYRHPDLGDDSDFLRDARFVGLNHALENSNKALEVEFTIVFNQLYIGDDRKTINNPDPSLPLRASKF